MIRATTTSSSKLVLCLANSMGFCYKHLVDPQQHVDTIRHVFQEAFEASEGLQQANLIGILSEKMIQETTNQRDLLVFVAQKRQCNDTDTDDFTTTETVVGCIIFSRLKFDCQPETNAMLLGPVSVRPAFQNLGIGKALIQYGVTALQEQQGNNMDLVVVYGNPKYYSKVLDFVPITTDIIPAPMPLSMPHGWQALSLRTNQQIQAIPGTSTCVMALRESQYW